MPGTVPAGAGGADQRAGGRAATGGGGGHRGQPLDPARGGGGRRPASARDHTASTSDRSPALGTTVPPPLCSRASGAAVGRGRQRVGHRGQAPGDDARPTSAPRRRCSGPGGRSGGPGTARIRPVPSAPADRRRQSAVAGHAGRGGQGPAVRPVGQGEQLPEGVERVVEVAHGQRGPAGRRVGPRSADELASGIGRRVVRGRRGARRRTGRCTARASRTTAPTAPASPATPREPAVPAARRPPVTSGRCAALGRPGAPRTRTGSPDVASPGSALRISRMWPVPSMT